MKTTPDNAPAAGPPEGGFFARLEERIRVNRSLLCVGIDPPLDSVAPGELDSFALRIVEAASDAACVFKPNIAFFEARGPEGLASLQRIIAHIHTIGFPVLLDAKRGDVSSTAEAYARAAFDTWGADAITVNPLLGGDSVECFASRADRGVFVLCHTSNPGAVDLQELETRDAPFYQRIARMAMSWNVKGNVGLVVGATYPEVLEKVREIAPHMWFLIPGVGSQGGDLEASLGAGLTMDGTGVIVNVSRGIAASADPRKAAREYRDRIEKAVEMAAHAHRHRTSGPLALVESIALGLYELGAVRFGRFTLKSGQESPIYIDLRLLVSDPILMRRVARALAGLVSGLAFDRIAAIPYGGLPIGTALSLETGKPMIYPRREVKDYGTRKAIEGLFKVGETVVVLDDLITTGGSKLESIEPLTRAGLIARDVAVLIDREQGGAEELAKRGFSLHALFTLSSLLEILTRAGKITETARAEVHAALGLPLKRA